MNWITKNWRALALTLGLGGVAVATGVLLAPSSPSLTRPLLVGHYAGSRQYLAAHAQADLTPPAGATAWVRCPMTDLGGNLQCTDQAGAAVELVKNGTPTYQVRTPIPVNGQGRKGVHFYGTLARVRAAGNSTASLAGVSGFTLEFVGTNQSPTSNYTILSSRLAAAQGGYQLNWGNTTNWLSCAVGDDAGHSRTCYISAANDALTHHYACVGTYAANDWTFAMYQDGKPVACTLGGAQTSNAIGNASPLSIGALSGYDSTYFYKGEMNEVRIRNVADSAATVLTNYKRTIETGQYWTDDANTLAHYKMNDAAVSNGVGLVDSSGNGNHLTVVVGAPTAQYGDPPYPMGGGQSRRGVWFTEAPFFAASDTSVGNQTTNDFSVTFWALFDAPAADTDVLVSKRDTNAGGGGWEVLNIAGVLKFWIGDGTHNAQVDVSGTVPSAGWHLVTVKANRSTTATADIDGVATGVSGSIAAANGYSITNSNPLTLGRHAVVGALPNYASGGIAEVLISNVSTSTAQHLALYKAFKVPTEISSYTQTTTRCYSHGTEGGFGERLGCYGPGQWPMEVKSTAVHAQRNPLGYTLPSYQAVTNVIGYSSEFNSWTSTAAVTANFGEAPDGSLTADKVVFSAQWQSTYKVVVGGGVPAAGQRWCESLFYKYVSGTCSGVRATANVDGGGGSAVNAFYLTDATGNWVRGSACEIQSSYGKGIYIQSTTAGACTVLFAKAQFEADNVTPPCTETVGNVSQTCNAPVIAATWSAKPALMPDSLYRGELLVRSSLSPWTSTATYKRVLGQTADTRVLLTEGQVPSFVLKNQGGTITGVARGKPIQDREASREYKASWDLDAAEGLTGTGASRRYAALSIDGKYQKTTLEARPRSTVDVQTQKDLNATTVYLGSDGNGNSCNCGIESWELYSKPAKVSWTAQADHVLTVDATAAGYLQSAATPDLCDFSFGVANANRWCWNGAGFSGSQYDVVNGVALAPSGTPTYQVPSGLLARGQGRRGVKFLDTSAQAVKASNASIASSSGSYLSWGAIFSARKIADNQTVMGTFDSGVGAGGGYALIVANGPGYVAASCIAGTSDGWNYSSKASGYYIADSAPGSIAQVICTAQKVAGNWQVNLYWNGITGTGGAATLATGAIANGLPLTIGSTPGYAAARSLNGEVYEAFVDTAATYSAADALALYKQTVQTGRYWNFAAISKTPTLHLRMNEQTLTNGVGIKDHSGNGNHLTVVNGTPTPNYRAAMWPMGSGVTKPTIGYVTGAYHSLAANNDVFRPGTNHEPFSAAMWIRQNEKPSVTTTLFEKYLNASNYVTVRSHSASGGVLSDLAVEGTVAQINNGSLVDGRWHLLVLKAVWGGASWTFSSSWDGGAFAAAGTTPTGNANLNTGLLAWGLPVGTVSGAQVIGPWLSNNYEITAANVAQIFGSSDPTGGLLTYARTSTSFKGACYDVAVDPIDGVRVRCFRDNEVPYAYRAENLATPGNEQAGIMLPRDAAVTNYLYYSELNTSWTVADLTKADGVALAPDGTNTAASLTESANNVTHYAYKGAAALSPLATGSNVSSCLYLKKGGGTRDWVSVAVINSSSVNGGWVNVNLATGAKGSSGGGAEGTLLSTSVLGVAGGWIETCVYYTCTRGVTCNTPTLVVQPRSGDTAWSWSADAFLGSTSNSTLMWGYRMTTTAPSNVYCPTTTASTTCNTPTSMYVAAANLTSWTRAQGVIASSGYTGLATGYLYDLHNGSNLNGAIRLLAPTTEAYLYDSAATLKQRLSLVNAQTGLTGATLVFDSGAAFYSTTRRAYGQTFQSTYAGPWPTYTTDSGANWTPAASTNLHLGAMYDGTLPINGGVQLLSIHGTR